MIADDLALRSSVLHPALEYTWTIAYSDGTI